jgi:hypothetical protein
MRAPSTVENESSPEMCHCLGSAGNRQSRNSVPTVRRSALPVINTAIQSLSQRDGTKSEFSVKIKEGSDRREVLAVLDDLETS